MFFWVSARFFPRPCFFPIFLLLLLFRTRDFSLPASFFGFLSRVPALPLAHGDARPRSPARVPGLITIMRRVRRSAVLAANATKTRDKRGDIPGREKGGGYRIGYVGGEWERKKERQSCRSASLALWARLGSRPRSDKIKLRGSTLTFPWLLLRSMNALSRLFILTHARSEQRDNVSSVSSATWPSTDRSGRYDDLCRAACSDALPAKSCELIVIVVVIVVSLPCSEISPQDVCSFSRECRRFLASDYSSFETPLLC